MAEHVTATVNHGEQQLKQNEHHNNNNNEDNKKDKISDPELFCCLLQPLTPDADPRYIGIRRLLLHQKAEAGILRRRVCLSISSFESQNLDRCYVLFYDLVVLIRFSICILNFGS
jgi:hypothetical protein